MYCIVCGTKNPEYGIFCYNCGNKLVRPPDDAQPALEATPNPKPAVINISAKDLADLNPFLFDDEPNKAASAPLPTVEAVNPVTPFDALKVASPSETVSPTPSEKLPASADNLPPIAISNQNPYGHNPFNIQSSQPPTPNPTPVSYNPYPGATQPPPGSPAYNPYANQVPNVNPNHNNLLQPSNPLANSYNPSSPNANPPSQQSYGGQTSLPNSNPYGFIPTPAARPSVAPNGEPYVVVDRPNSFYKYKNKDGKKVYAAYGEIWPRFAAAIVDTLVVTVPFFFLTLVYFLSLGQDALNKFNDAYTNDNTVVIEQYLPHWYSLVIMLSYLAYCTFLTARTGQTLGKRLFRLKVVGLDGNPPDLRTSFMRNLFGFAASLGSYISYYNNPIAILLGQALLVMVVLGFMVAIFDARKQGWHDRLAGTLVVKASQLVEGVDFPAKG